MQRDRADIFASLPTEVALQIIALLPICDTWRLRVVNRKWNKLLSGEDAARAVCARWNTHSEYERASSQRFPQPSPTQSIVRIQAFLSGRPLSYATISPEGYMNLQMHGKWLAYCSNASTHESGSPMHIELWDLVTGSKHLVVSEPTSHTSFVLTAHMIAYSVQIAALGQQRWEDESLDNALVTIDLETLTAKTTSLSFPTPMQHINAQAAHRSCFAIKRQQAGSPWHQHVEIYDRESDKSWSFVWKATGDECSKFTIDTDKQIVAFWSGSTRYARGTEPGVNNMLMRCGVAVEQFSFEGLLLRKSEKQVLLDNDDYRGSGLIDPFISSLSPAGSAQAWTAYVSYWLDEGINANVLVDWDSGLPCANAYYRLADRTYHRLDRKILVWKNLVFHYSEQGVLHVSRHSDRASIDAVSVTSCDLQAPTQVSTGDRSERKNMPWLVAVNESFLISYDRKAISIYAFDPLACEGPIATKVAEAGSAVAQVDGQSLLWKSAEGLFVKDNGDSIARRGSQERRTAAVSSVSDPVRDSLTRLSCLSD